MLIKLKARRNEYQNIVAIISYNVTAYLKYAFIYIWDRIPAIWYCEDFTYSIFHTGRITIFLFLHEYCEEKSYLSQNFKQV